MTFLISKSSLCVTLATSILSCGTSIYKPLANSKTEAAKKEEAMMALDQNDFVKAEGLFADLWGKAKTDENAQLYSVAMMGVVGLDIFSMVSSALTKCKETTATSSSSSSCSSGNVLSMLSSVLPTGADKTVITAKLKSVLGVLNEAPTKSAVGPLMCFSGGIYLNLVIEDLQSKIDSVKTDLTADLATLNPLTCGATGDAQTAAVGAKVQENMALLGELGTAIVSVTESVGSCIQAVSSDKESSASDIQKSIGSLKTNADKGCTLPATGSSSTSIPVPSCMQTFLIAGSKAEAGDDTIDGCELFLNCMDGSCF